MGNEVVIMDEMSKKPSSTSSKHFILIHGVGHGAWCWYKVRTLLESSGHTVTCLDLKAAGLDRSDVDAIVSFHDYNHPLVHLLSSLPNQQKVILVGHSAGGLSVTDAIHKFPEKIEAAVYVAATMLKLGFHTDQDIKDGVPDFSEWGEVFDHRFGSGEDQPPTSAMFKQHLFRKILYQMSPIEDCTLAKMLMRPFPMTLAPEAKYTKSENCETVRRIYVKTLQDRVLKLDQQEVMIKRWAPSEVYNIDTDHSPFFSSPFLLSGLLSKVALHSL